jgi:hypothetical protein
MKNKRKFKKQAALCKRCVEAANLRGLIPTMLTCSGRFFLRGRPESFADRFVWRSVTDGAFILHFAILSNDTAAWFFGGRRRRPSHPFRKEHVVFFIEPFLNAFVATWDSMNLIGAEGDNQEQYHSEDVGESVSNHGFGTHFEVAM